MATSEGNGWQEVEGCATGSSRRTGFVSGLVELLRHREHGKTARTLAICTCVLGAIAAVSAAKAIQFIYWSKSTSEKGARARAIALHRRGPLKHSARARRHVATS